MIGYTSKLHLNYNIMIYKILKYTQDRDYIADIYIYVHCSIIYIQYILVS